MAASQLRKRETAEECAWKANDASEAAMCLLLCSSWQS